MHLALKISIDNPTCPRESKGCASLIEMMDKILVSHKIEPVTWITDESDGKLLFEAYIPADCMPELDEAAEFIAVEYAEFKKLSE